MQKPLRSTLGIIKMSSAGWFEDDMKPLTGRGAGATAKIAQDQQKIWSPHLIADK